MRRSLCGGAGLVVVLGLAVGCGSGDSDGAGPAAGTGGHAGGATGGSGGGRGGAGGAGQDAGSTFDAVGVWDQAASDDAAAVDQAALGDAGADQGSAGDSAGDDGGPPAAPADRPTRAGLQYNGAIAVFRPHLKPASVTIGDADAGADDDAGTGAGSGEWFEISAPVLPKTQVLYQQEGAAYPGTTPAQAAFARAAALSFETLLVACRETNPDIVVKSEGGPTLTDEQIAHNYDLLANCAYKQFTSKPYWIPQLLLDVDVCAEALGSSWRTPTETDVAGLTPSEFAAMQTTLDGLGGDTIGGAFFSLSIWTRMNDGSMKNGQLDPAASPRFLELNKYGAAEVNLRNHYEGNLALRCVRTTAAQE
jgi:hypothetical protein